MNVLFTVLVLSALPQSTLDRPLMVASGPSISSPVITCGPNGCSITGERCDCGTDCNCPNCPHNAKRVPTTRPMPVRQTTPVTGGACANGSCGIQSTPRVIRSKPMTIRERMRFWNGR